MLKAQCSQTDQYIYAPAPFWAILLLYHKSFTVSIPCNRYRACKGLVVQCSPAARADADARSGGSRQNFFTDL